jgi:polyhydroxybutyrate depolymerase
MRRSVRILYFFLYFAAVGAACFGLAAQAAPSHMTWTVDGEKREALVYGPTRKDPTGKSPVIFGFHGRGGDMQDSAETMRFESVWPEAIIVYMQGTPITPGRPGNFWRYPGQPRWDSDLKYFDTALDAMRAKFPVDDRRIYVTGFSNGSGFSYALWSARASTLAAVGIVAGRIAPGVNLTEPKPVLVVAGENDQTIKYEIQVEAMKTVKALDGVSEPGAPCGKGCTLYASSKDAPVITYIHGGGHDYPPGTPANIVKFFKEHELPAK